MSTHGNFGLNFQENSPNKLNEHKNMIHTSEAIIIGDTCKQKCRPNVPTVKDAIQVLNKAIIRPPIPTINETVLLNKQYILPKNKPTKVDKIILNNFVEEHKTKKNTKALETKLYIEKKKKERTTKCKLDLIEKKKLAEERKKKLDQLQKTTRELAIASNKQKNIHVQDKCKIGINLPTETNEPKVDQTWSPPPKVESVRKPLEALRNVQKIGINLPTESKESKVDQAWSPPPEVKSFKKPLEAFKNVQKKSMNGFKTTDECSNDTKDIISTICTSSKISKKPSKMSTTKLIDPKPQIRDVTKPENLFSKLKFNDDYQLFGENFFDISMPKLIDTDIPFVPKNNNDVTLLNESCHDNEKLQGDNANLNRETLSMPDINLSIKPSDIKSNSANTGLQLPIRSHKEIMKSIDNLEELQKLLFEQCLPVKNNYSESTQTENLNDILSLSTSKSLPPPMNFISVLKCKHNLQQSGKNNLEFYEPAADLNMNEYTLTNNLYPNKINNVESTEFNKPDVNCCDEEVNLPNVNHIETKNCLGSYKSSLIDEPDKPKSNNLSSIENNNCEEKIDIINNDKLFTKLSLITNEDIKQVLKKLNYDFNLLSKNNCCNSNNLHNTCINLKFDENNLNNKSSHCFPKIHDEFQAELDTLDQLNNSLCDIERMSCDMSIKSNEQSIELNDHCNSNNDNDNPTPMSKLNALSSNMMCVDKTITGFSIQMFEQLIKDEELKAKQHRTIISLREKSLTNRLKWEVTMYDLQVKNLKNRPGHEKQFQLFKQKQRGSVKKLEHSLSQVKRLGRVIDSVYKQRFIMLEEHLQHLRNQSSSKKVIRKLKSLEQFPKKEEHACRSFNSHVFKQFNKSDCFGTNDSECDSVNTIESKKIKPHITSPTKFESDKSQIILRNQATSPISHGTNKFDQVQNVEVQTDVKCSSQSVNDKSIQTSKTKCNHINNENIKSFNQNNFFYKNEMFDAIKTKDKRSLSPILPTSPVKLKKYLTETSISTNSEQSDLDTHIISLQEQLEARKLESFRLKKEQKKLKLENLKAKEQDLLKQINLYDKKIEESRKSLMVEIKKKNMHLSKSSIKIDSSSSTNSSCSVLQNIINIENDHSQHNMYKSDKITRTDGKKYFYPIATNVECDRSISLNKPVNELQNKNVYKSKENHDMHTNSFDSVNIDSYNCIEQSFQSIETIPVCEDVQLHEKHTSKEVNASNKSNEIETEVNIIFESQPQKSLDIYTSNDLKVNLKEETHSCEVNETLENGIHLGISLCKYSNSIPIELMSETSNNQELYLKTSNRKSLIIHNNINCSNTSSILSDSGAIQRNVIVNLNENDTDVCKMQKNSVSQFKEPLNKIGLDDIYSPDFTSDEYISEIQGSYQFNKNESNDSEQSNETSYEEERSEGEIIFEDKTFIEQYSDDHGDFVQNENSTDEKVHVITTNIFNYLLKDTKKSLKFNMNKSLFCSVKNGLDNLTEETPLLLILKREEENQNRIILSEQATIISDLLFKQHLQPLFSEVLRMYLPRLNEIEMEKLTVYLKWSSTKRKKIKLSECLIFQHKIDVDNENSFEIFFQKYLEQKKSQTFQDDSIVLFCDESNDVILSHTQQEAEKLKQEQIRIEEEIERLRMSEEVQFFREIPNKPPPPYKSPTKNKSLIDIPYTSDEVHKIVLTAANQVFNGSQSALSNDYILNSDSIVHADYKTLIFDYCKEIALDLFIDDTYLPLWKRSIKRLKHFRARPKNPKDLSDIVIKKMNQIIDIDECEEKVNKFVVNQMHEEDSKWTDFQMDELEIQNDIAQNLMKKLVCDTIKSTKTNFYLKFT